MRNAPARTSAIREGSGAEAGGGGGGGGGGTGRGLDHSASPPAAASSSASRTGGPRRGAAVTSRVRSRLDTGAVGRERGRRCAPELAASASSPSAAAISAAL